MRRLFLADVHANLPAFEAVLDHAGPVDEICFLGDVVGWGPHPAECVDLLRSLGARSVAGNRDVAVLADLDRVGLAGPFRRRWIEFLRAAWDAEWSREYTPGEALPRPY